MQTEAMGDVSWQRLAPLRELLRLWLQLREIDEPLTTLEGLRQTLRLIARLAELVGVDGALVERLLAAVDDDTVLRIVLAIVQYATGLIEARGAEQGSLRMTLLEDGHEVRVEPQSLIEWLPLVLGLLNLLRQLRRADEGLVSV